MQCVPCKGMSGNSLDAVHAFPCRWDLNIEGDDCLLHSLVGHAKRSFSAVWSPLQPHLLLSGSDDATARVWDTRSGNCVALLAGHKTEVRALCWHTELPWLVLTGDQASKMVLPVDCGLKWCCCTMHGRHTSMRQHQSCSVATH